MSILFHMVRGWYDDVLWGKQAHWWCVDLSGNIIDPTIDQFPTKCGEYIEFNGIVSCSECEKEIPEKDAIIIGNGNYAVCSQRCALSLVGIKQ